MTSCLTGHLQFEWRVLHSNVDFNLKFDKYSKFKVSGCIISRFCNVQTLLWNSPCKRSDAVILLWFAYSHPQLSKTPTCSQKDRSVAVSWTQGLNEYHYGAVAQSRVRSVILHNDFQKKSKDHNTINPNTNSPSWQKRKKSILLNSGKNTKVASLAAIQA